MTELEAKLWTTCELLRGKMHPTQYMEIPLELIFLKFMNRNWRNLIQAKEKLAEKIEIMIKQIEQDNPDLKGVMLPNVFYEIPNDTLKKLIELFDTIPSEDSKK